MLDDSAEMVLPMPLAGNDSTGKTAILAEGGFAEVLAGLVGREQVPVESHFFDALGAQKNGTLKSDRIAIGQGCTIWIGALVHDSVTVGDGAVLARDCFLMRGEQVPPGARWGVNPTIEIPEMQYPENGNDTAGAQGKRRVGSW